MNSKPNFIVSVYFCSRLIVNVELTSSAIPGSVRSVALGFVVVLLEMRNTTVYQMMSAVNAVNVMKRKLVVSVVTVNMEHLMEKCLRMILQLYMKDSAAHVLLLIASLPRQDSLLKMDSLKQWRN